MSYQNRTEMNYLAPSTIDEAERTGVYTPGQIDWMRKTMNSGNPYVVDVHRGIETYLNNTTGFKSPT